MELSRLAVRLRPRGGWEAMDLGFHMARTWWRPVWGTWCAVFVPTAVLLHLLFWEYPWIAMAITWWLKPAFDRFVLHVVSRAVFGVPPGVRETLGAWRQVLSPGLLSALIWIYRFSPRRSFTMPVAQLEHLTGREGSKRRSILCRRLNGFALWLTSTCSFFELFVILSVGIGLQLLAPGAQSEGLDFERLLAGRGEDGAWTWAQSLPWCLAIAAIEPFYVCAGFALYLNRRAILEGWDIELQLRRLDERLSRPASALAALLAAVLLAAALPEPAHAQDKSAREEIREVLKAPELTPWREELRWQFRREPEKAPRPDRDGPNWGEFGRFIASIAQAVAWIAAALLAAAVLYYVVRYVRARLAERRGDDWRPPEALFGLAVAPESLPADVAGTAAALAREGRVREALSLLYRGALSALVHRERVRLVEGDTEADTLVAAKRVLARPAAEYFGALVGAWIAAAYAGRLPDADGALALAGGWAAHFAAPRAEAPA